MNAVRCIGEQKQNINSLRSLCCLALATCHEKYCHCREEQKHERFADRKLARLSCIWTTWERILSSTYASIAITCLARWGIVKWLIYSTLVSLVGYIGDLVSVIKGAISIVRHTWGATWHAISALRYTTPGSIVHTTIPLLCGSGGYNMTKVIYQRKL